MNILLLLKNILGLVDGYMFVWGFLWADIASVIVEIVKKRDVNRKV